MLNVYIDINFEVIKKDDDSRCANGNDIRPNNLAPIGLFSSCKLTTSSAKHLEAISHAHNVSLLYEFLTSSKDGDEFSIGFDRIRNRRRDELTANKNIKSKCRLRIMLKDVFGFAECQEKATYELGYK